MERELEYPLEDEYRDVLVHRTTRTSSSMTLRGYNGTLNGFAGPRSSMTGHQRADMTLCERPYISDDSMRLGVQASPSQVSMTSSVVG